MKKNMVKGVGINTLFLPLILGFSFGSATGFIIENGTIRLSSVSSNVSDVTPVFTTTGTFTDPPNRYCSAYCNLYGSFVERQYCDYDEFCCGSRSFRYCCPSVTNRIPNYPDDYSCDNSLWGFYDWKVIVGLLGTVMVVMLIGACVYYCCMGFCRRNETAQRIHRRFRPNDDHNLNTISGDNISDTESGLRNSFRFDPSNPNAFEPPPYDSLAKDPPKYSDLFSENGQENQAFVGDSTEGASGAATSMAAAEDMIAMVTAEGATEGSRCGPTEGAATGATGGRPPATNGSTSGNQASSDPFISSNSSRQGRNASTEVTSDSSQSVAAPSSSNTEPPPPYTRMDRSVPSAPPAMRRPNQQIENSGSLSVQTEAPSSSGNAHHIELQTRTPSSGQQSNSNC